MRRLAENTVDLTQEIKQLIGELEDGAQPAMQAAAQAQREALEVAASADAARVSVKSIQSRAEQADRAAHSISGATHDQRQGTEQFASAMARIRDGTRTAAQEAAEASRTAEVVLAIAQALRRIVDNFRA
jgi:methyl-accepting chemotaxis protein